MARKLHVYDPEIAQRMIRLLKAAGQPYREKANFLYMRCPFHGGRSLGFWIHKSGRFGKCWRCEHQAGWNEYAGAAGLPKIKRLDGEPEGNEAYSLGYLHQALDGEGAEETTTVQLPNGMVPWTKSWRKIRADFLSNLGVLEWYDDTSGYSRILFPITFDDEIVGYQAGRPPGEYWKRDPKYRASPNLPSDEGFFGLDQIRPDRIQLIVLVEGVYDCLRLWQNGIPAIANFGASSTWTEEKAAILLGLPRLKVVVSAFDWDDDGHDAHTEVKEALQRSLRVHRAQLPRIKRGKYHDAGSAPQSWHRSFYEDLRGTGWSGRWKLRPLISEYKDYSFPRIAARFK